MSETKSQILGGVAETLLITLYLRAMETQRPDALIKDENAVALVKRMDYDFNRIKLLHLKESNKLAIILRNREFDRYARDFLVYHPQAVVVHIGCGLDARYERVDDGCVEWFDLDLPDVIELRRKLIGGEKERYHLLGCSVLEDAWMDAVNAFRDRPCLFLAEGVFMYLVEAQVKSLVLNLSRRFPGAELVFDGYSPLHLWISNLKTARFGLKCRWGIYHGERIESWGDGIRLLDEWGLFDQPEPRLAKIQWMRPIDRLIRTIRIYHFSLSQTVQFTPKI